MKTFTNYAAKAKQFLNLLQGYTKGIRITAILILLLMGVSNAWGATAELENGQYVYFDITSNTGWASDDAAMRFNWFWNSGDHCCWNNGTKIDGTNVYYATTQNAYTRGVQMLRMSSNYGTQYNYSAMKTVSSRNSDNQNCVKLPTDGWDNCTLTWGTYVPPMNNVTIMDNGTTITSGSGIEADPYIIAGGATVKVKATADLKVPDPSPSIKYKFSNDGGSNYNTESTTNTYTFTAAAYSTSAKTYTVMVSSRAAISTTYNTEKTSSKIYFKVPAQYTVTFDANGHGTAPSSQEVLHGAKAQEPTAPIAAGYTFGGWYKESGCTNKYDFNTAVTSNLTLYAEWTLNATYSLNVVAGNGISQVAGSTDPITLGNKYDIKATPETGYTFSSWTANPVANATFESQTSAQTKVTVKNGSVTVTAFATENMSTLTTSNNYDAGNPSYAVPSATVSEIGIATTATVTATAAGNGYTFTGWTLTNCTRTDGGADNATSITVRSNGDGKAATVVANYAEDLTTSWVLKGSFVDDFATAYKFVKKSGESTGKVAYVSLDLADSKAYRFKVVNGSTWYGNNNSDEQYWIKATAENWDFYSDAGDCHMKSSVAGTYTFKIDFSGTNPKVSVYFPTAYTLTYGSGAGGSGTVTANNSIKSGDLVLAGTSVSLTATPASGYDFAAWYSDQACESAVVSSNNPYTFSINSNTTLYAKWKAQSFELTWDLNGGRITIDGTPKGSVAVGTTLVAPTVEKDYYDFAGWDPTVPTTMPAANATYTAQWTPKKYAITYKDQGDKPFSGTHESGYPTQHTYNTTTTLLGATKSGYTFAGWYRDSECAGARVETLGADVTEAITLYAKWEVASYTITFDKQEGTGGTTSVTAQYGAKLSAITIPSRDGYLFDGYYTQTSGNGTKYYNADGTTDKNMPYDVSTLYAKWVPYSQCIFFKNTLDWKNVYVYTFSNNVWYDNEDSNTQYGPGVCTKVNVLEFAKMTQINNTDIYYYILTKQNGFNHIAFSDADMNNWNEFYGNNAIYRADRNDQLPLFIPKKSQTPTTTNSTKYYSSGIWMKYNSTESGYDWRGATDENNQEQWSKKYDFTASKPGGYSFTATVEFDNTSTHYFKIHNTKGDWFGNGGTMTQNNCTDWTFGTDNKENAKITPTITGKYIFTVYLGDGEVSVSLDYPLSVGDYRLAYKDKTPASHHPGHYLKKHSTSQTDIVSFFIHYDQEPVIFVEKCTKIQNGIPTWEKVTDITNNPAASITESGVYNFSLQQIEGQTLPILVNEAMPYTGNFYIRTDAAEGGWDSFRQQSNQITYSSFADAHSDFNHYYCKYIEAGKNVKFTIANDYSYCISDTLDNDEIIKEGQSSTGCLPINANVRFGWDSKTNEISRAYIKGAGMTSDRFLVLQGKDNNLKDANGAVIPKGTGNRTGLLANEEILVDQQNWIYQVDVTANKNTFIKLVADYNGTTQYFKGKAEEYTPLLSSTASTDYKIRLIYDFKSNHLVTAWLAGGNTVEGEKVLGADMMVIRKDQRQAEQLNFDPTNSKMNEVGTGYAVMTFTQPHITDNTKTERERSLYWVSFPFDVKVSDVFGFGEYAEHWILQYYDGAERAEKGLFSDSGTYWKYIEDKNTTLLAGTGYVLALDLNKIEFLHGATEVSLYFPSTGSLNSINGVLPTEATVPEHWCNIDREWTEGGTKYHHKYTDSHWNLIGVPGFADITNFDVTAYHFTQYKPDVSFYYAFNLKNSTYTVASAATNFQAMYSYMVQFAGTIDWVSKTVSEAKQPEELAARRNSDAEPERVVLRLELTQGEEVADQTFVQLQQEGATANFDLSLDLTKIMNSGFSNIYTLTDSLKIQVAGNALPMEETVVSVGVNIAAAGEYTFRMPDGTEGMVVELIDYEANTTTNLLLDDYTVNLPTGSNETRFALSIKPEKTATNVGNIGGTMNDGQGVRKFIIDGKLYLQKDGMLYDAQGHIVR